MSPARKDEIEFKIIVARHIRLNLEKARKVDAVLFQEDEK